MVPPLSPASISLPARYRVARHIANGGMASVWEAHDELLDRSVAVKLLAEHLTADSGMRRRFQREARAQAGLSNHPNVVTIYDFGEHDGRSFIVMELMRGGSVADLLRDGVKLRRDNVLRWLAEAASALDAAHEANVIHRDVKPGNMLLDERGRLALGDFGIARLADTDQFTQTGQVLGTAAYVSPEQALGDRVDPASDRYSLAVVAFEMLTRTKPFQAEHYAAQARAHIEDPPPTASERDPEVPPAVDEVLKRGMAKDPRARYPSSTAFAAALREAFEAPRAVAAPVAAPEPATDATMRMDPTAYAPPARRATEAPRRREPLRPRPPVQRRPPEPERRGGRWIPIALAALIGALVLGAVVLLGGGDGEREAATPNEPRAERRQEASPEPTREATAEATAEETATPEPTAEATATPEATSTPTPTPEAEQPPQGGGTDEGKAATLNAQGFRLLQAGNAQGAIGPLSQAYAACEGSQAVDPCGYALFNYGKALNDAGRHDEAAGVLEERLARFPDDQPATVQAELARARAG